MTDRAINIPGWSGIDTTTDPFILGKKSQDKSTLAYNYRVKNEVRAGRNGFTPVVDFASGEYFKKSGVYFPPKAKAILPHISVDYLSSFYLASQETDVTDEYTVEFWYRADYFDQTREIFCAPVDFGAGKTRHMCLEFVPDVDTYTNRTSMNFYMIIGDNDTTEDIQQGQYLGGGYITTDGDWHHIAIYKASGADDVFYTMDGEGPVTMSLQGGHNSYNVIRDDTFKNYHSTPHYYNFLRLGGDDMSLAEFRIWSAQRTLAEIGETRNSELLGTETNLVVYIPFNEGGGKHFTEQVGSGRGHFYPQEPYVNDDNELVFTGYDCMAFPSLRGSWWFPDGETETTHKNGSFEGAYEGGILWDTVLQLQTDIDREEEGLFYGTAQLRIRLRQLKEGVICGRLGLLYDKTDEAYRLFFFNETGGTSYVSEAVVDDDWIGVEKTITIKYWGNVTQDPDEIVEFHIDDDTGNISEVSPLGLDYWGDENSTALNDSVWTPFLDTEGEDDSGGAIGGSPAITDMCIAFDLIFFRQWVDRTPAFNIEALVADTYNVDKLPDKYRYYSRGLSGYFYRDAREIYLDADSAVFEDGTHIYPYIRIPIHYRSSTFAMDEGDSYMLVTDDPSADKIPKQDIMIRPIIEYNASQDDQVAILGSAHTYAFKDGASATWGNINYFNGALTSTLVNDFNSDTFKLNQLKRSVFYKDEDADAEKVDHEIHSTITDDSPLQSVEKAGTYQYETRYLILTLTDRHTTITDMRSLKPRWCDGPVDPTTLPVIRGVYRYTSEDKEVDRLVVVAWNTVWELDPDTGEITNQKWAWMERNSDELVSFLAVNNMLLAMDSTSMIKINYKGNWSRCGLERPMEMVMQTWSGSPGGVYENASQHAWAAQFYDSENNSYSGTIPIYKDEWQGVKVVATSPGLNMVHLSIRSSKEYNIDRCLIWRTTDLEDTGTASDLYLSMNTETVRSLSDNIVHKDIWTDIKIQERSYLSGLYIGVDLIPKPCKAMALGYNRVFLFNNDDEKSSLFWSDVDALGFAKPDHFPPSYKMIVEEGDTTEGTAMIEYSNQLFAFKQNAIFLIEQTSSVGFGNRLIYKGVGCVNQKSVVVAGNAIIFVDYSGIYKYAGGEPVMLSVELSDFFRNEVDQDTIAEKAFVLFDKKDDIVYTFLPSSGASYCDRTVVYDMRRNTFTLDMIPYVTCGYVDDQEIYLGTPYGQVLKVDRDSYLDGVETAYSGTGYVI